MTRRERDSRTKSGAPQPVDADAAARWLQTREGQQLRASMIRRMGDTTEDRLRWVVDFARKDLSDLRPEERVALGHDLRWIAYWSMPDAVGIGSALSDPRVSIPDRRLREYQRQIAAALRALVIPGADYAPWKLPGRPVLARAGDRGYGYVLTLLGDERTDILSAVATLLLQAGQHLRACAYCHVPFAAKENRQRYCTPQCSQRMRNTRRKPRPRKGEQA